MAGAPTPPGEAAGPTPESVAPDRARGASMVPMKLLLAPSLLLGLSLVACCATAPVPPGVVVGEPVVERPVEAFAVVDANPEAYFDQTLLVEATVSAVCQKAGCWLQVEDEGRTALVRWETGCGGRYKFPSDVVGRRIVVQGSFYPKTISPEDLQHLQEEGGGDLEIEAEGYEFNASAIVILDR